MRGRGPGRDEVSVLTLKPHAAATAYMPQTNIRQSGLTPPTLYVATLMLVKQCVWPLNSQPLLLRDSRSSALRLAWGFGDSSLESVKSVPIHCAI